MGNIYTNKRSYAVTTSMSQADLNHFKHDVQKSDLQAKFYKNPIADPNTNLNIIQNVLTNAKRAYFPEKTKRLNKYNYKTSPWITKGIRKLIKRVKDITKLQRT